MHRAVFLDRDGTLIEDRGNLRRESDVVFFSGTVDALRRLNRRFKLFIVTHQGGIAEGEITPEEVETVNGYVVSCLAAYDIEIAEVYVCPHSRDDNCRCIKPNPYFLKEAAHSHDLDLGSSYTVGDHPHDVELATQAGACGMYVLTGHGTKHRHDVPADTVVAEDIEAVADRILNAFPEA